MSLMLQRRQPRMRSARLGVKRGQSSSQRHPAAPLLSPHPQLHSPSIHGGGTNLSFLPSCALKLNLAFLPNARKCTYYSARSIRPPPLPPSLPNSEKVMAHCEHEAKEEARRRCYDGGLERVATDINDPCVLFVARLI